MAESTKEYLDYAGLSHYHGKAKAAFADAEEFSTVKGKVETLETTGGQPNVIEGLTIGGAAVTLDNKIAALGSAAGASTAASVADDATLPTGAAVSTYVAAQIAAAVTKVFKPAGSVAFSGLPALAAGVLGNVYNVTDAFTSTADFVDGADKGYPAGTNVVVVDTDDTGESPSYKFDVLPGFIDLSGYQLSSNLSSISNTKIDELFAESGE